MGTGESDDIVTQLPNAWARGAEPSYLILSPGHGAYLRRSAGPDAAWSCSVAAAARHRRDRPARGSVTHLADQMHREDGRVVALR